MKNNTKSSVTLSPKELALVNALKKQIGAKSKAEVIRKALLQFQDGIDREKLRAGFSDAAEMVRKSTNEALEEFEHLTSEGLIKK